VGVAVRGAFEFTCGFKAELASTRTDKHEGVRQTELLRLVPLERWIALVRSVRPRATASRLISGDPETSSRDQFSVSGPPSAV
jgi:hypothetical protein